MGWGEVGKIRKKEVKHMEATCEKPKDVGNMFKDYKYVEVRNGESQYKERERGLCSNPRVLSIIYKTGT